MSQIVSAWPFAASVAAAVAVRGLRWGRRRDAINEALHELRRPLQALALADPAAAARDGAEVDLSLRMASAALERLEREVNGAGAGPLRRRPFAARPLLEEAVRRWRGPVARRGGQLELSWTGPGVEVEGDRGELARALDNLIANALEHGGPRIAVSGRAAAGSLRLAVVDRGGGKVPPPRRRLAVARLREALVGALGARRRRGHGLRIVRRVAAGHGGEFELRREAGATEAVLALPRDRRRRSR